MEKVPGILASWHPGILAKAQAPALNGTAGSMEGLFEQGKRR